LGGRERGWVGGNGAGWAGTTLLWHPDAVSNEVGRSWLPVDEVAKRLGVSTSRVRRMVEDRHLLAVRRDGVLSVPEDFLAGAEPLRELRGTIILLGDGGFEDPEAVDWLLSPEESLGVAPIDALRAGRKAEVRRVAQALAI
jgi:excisionase family DNA binding protein